MQKGIDTTLKKIPDDEEIFVLRAQDITAPETIMHWITLNLRLHSSASDEKLREAFECALKMRNYYKRKMPD